VSAIDSNGRTIWIVDAHRDDGQRFVVRADEKLRAFVKLESAIQACGNCASTSISTLPALSPQDIFIQCRDQTHVGFSC
jgi:hypothetical protein